jgi:hypothetical protein
LNTSEVEVLRRPVEPAVAAAIAVEYGTFRKGDVAGGHLDRRGN